MKLGPDAAKLAADNSLQSVNDALANKGEDIEADMNIDETKRGSRSVRRN